MTVVTLHQLALAVLSSDHYQANACKDTLAHVLELALKNVIGLVCLADDVTAVDLGNNHVLLCRVKHIGVTETVTRTSGFDLVAHLYRQRDFSARTFGPGARTEGVLNHIRKELVEVEAAPSDVTEWADLVLLSLDGAWRAGHTPEAIAQAIQDKQGVNEQRVWPDWRTADPTKAIEHVRTEAAHEVL
jgi:Protein of unknown function (DUF550)